MEVGEWRNLGDLGGSHLANDVDPVRILTATDIRMTDFVDA